MPDHVTIQRIAKLLARATSPEAAEAQVALDGAFKRMKRDGVSFDDLLTLPKNDLYQDVMIKLVDLILAERQNLSPASRREAYEKYILLIVAKFSGDWDGQRTGQESSGSSQTQQRDEREAAARAYEERRRAQEAAREREQSRATGGNSQKAGSQSRPNAQESPGQPSKTYTWSWKGRAFSFSPAAFQVAMQPVWGRESILWFLLHDPVRCFRLLTACMLWGMGFAVALIFLAAFAHAVTNTGPIWDLQLKRLFGFLTVAGMVWKIWAFWQSGRFRR